MADPKKVAKPKNSVLAGQVASTQNDPNFYGALKVLPNPDAVLRKLGKSHDVFDAISYDSHVIGDLKSIQGDVNGRKWRIVQGGEDTQDIAAFELCQKVYKNRPAVGLSWSNTIWNMYQAVPRGYSVHEVIWERQGNHLVPCSLIDIPSRRFAFGAEHELRLLTKAQQQEGEAVDNFKFLMTRHLPSYENPYGLAVFSALFWPYTFKHNGMRWYTKFVEKFGIPKIIGRYPLGTQDSEVDKLLTSLGSMIEDAVATIPEGTAVELLEAKHTGTTPHEGLHKICNAEMSKALTSQTLGSDHGDNGSRALGDVHLKRQSSRGEADSQMIAESMSEFCSWITMLNFANAKAPTFEFYDDAELSESTINTLEKAATIAPIKKAEFYKLAQLTQPEEDDEVVFLGNQEKPTAEFSAHHKNCAHHNFSESDVDIDELSALAAQGNKDAEKALSTMFEPIEELIEQAEDLDDLKEQLPNLLDEIDTTDFERAIADTNVIAKAKGIEDAKR